MAVTTLAEALAVCNTAYENLGYAQAGANQITADNLATYGLFPPNQINAIIEQMNLILEQRFFMNLFNAEKNPWRQFIIDMTRNGFGILDVYQEFLDGAAPMWSSTDSQIAADMVGRAADAVARKYHTTPMSHQFKATIDEREYSKIFTEYGLPRFVDCKISNLSASAEYWLKNQIIDEVMDMLDAGDAVYKQGYTLTTIDGVKSMIEDIRSTMDDMLIPTPNYNKDQIVSMADDPSQLFLITTPENMERLRVYVNSGAYNLSDVMLNAQVIYAPNGTDLGSYQNENVLFLLVDRRAIVIGIKTWRITNFLVPNTLYHNNWLTVEGLRSHNTFFGCVAFTGVLGNFGAPVLYSNDGTAGATATVTVGATAIVNKTATAIDAGSVITIGGTYASATITLVYLSGEAESVTYSAAYTMPQNVANVYIAIS